MLASWKKSYDKPRQHIKKQRYYFADKGPYSPKAMVFPVAVYGCESWTIKKAEHQRTDTFEMWCWRRFLRVPWTARISNQSILKEISLNYSLEGLMLKLKLQYFGHLVWRADFIWKDLDARKDWRREKRGTLENEMVGWHHLLNGLESEQTPGVGDGQGSLACCSPRGPKELDKTELLNWTELKCEWGLPKLQYTTPMVTAEELGEWIQEATWTRKQDWPQIAEMPMKGTNSPSPQDCILQFTES